MIFELLKERRRRRLRARPFPKQWLTLVQRHVVFFHRLSASDRAELLGHVQVFLAEKRFEGCGGFAITDEVRVTIAAQACLLLLHRKTDYFPGLLTILVYPLSYMVQLIPPMVRTLFFTNSLTSLTSKMTQPTGCRGWGRGNSN